MKLLTKALTSIATWIFIILIVGLGVLLVVANMKLLAIGFWIAVMVTAFGMLLK